MPRPRDAAALALALVALWGGLGSYGLVEPSDARYAEIAPEMWASGDWAFPRLLGILHFHKPPLICWLAAAGYSALGPGEWGARACQGVLGLGLVGLLWRFARRHLDPGRWLHRLMRRGGERAFPSRYAEKMRANMGRTLIAMTFLPNVRFFAPIVAGTVGTPWRRFIVYDALGVLLYVGVYLTLGYHFHLQLDRLVRGFELYRHAAVYALLLAGVAGLGVFWHPRRSAP